MTLKELLEVAGCDMALYELGTDELILEINYDKYEEVEKYLSNFLLQRKVSWFDIDGKQMKVVLNND